MVTGQTFNDPLPTSEDNFGFAVDTDNEYVLIGDRRDDSSGTNVGQVHLFDRDKGNFLRTFDDPTDSGPGNFGSAVALDSGRVLIGARFDSDQGPLVGQAHLFNAKSGALIHTFDDPTETQSDFFGTSVAISGNIVAVGALGDDTNGVGIGQAHLFNAVTGALIITVNDPTPTAFDSFGQSVSIDGSLLIVGDPGDDTNGFGVGQAHLFDANNGQFIRTYDDPTITGSDSFGTSVAISGGLVAIGAPGDDSMADNAGEAHVFVANTGTLIQTFSDPAASADDAFGNSVAIDGNQVVIGAPKSAFESVASGQAFLFDAFTGQLSQTYHETGGEDDDEFGFAVAVDSGGVLIGIPFDDSAGFDVGKSILFSANEILLGDLNGDGAVDLLDIAPFVALLTSGEFQIEADINMDGVVDLLDIAPFVDLLSGD